MIAITIDIDWAPDAIVKSVVDLLEEKKIPATFFCTDYRADISGNSSNLISLIGPRHEIGLHPNFQGVSNYAHAWSSILEVYPNVHGWKSHNGVTGFPIALEGVKHRIKYEVFSLVYNSFVQPFQLDTQCDGMYGFMTHFSDARAMSIPDYSWEASKIKFIEKAAEPNELFIASFHPNILYYDMSKNAEYDDRKNSYHSVDNKSCFKNKALKGSMKIFQDLLHQFNHNNFCTISKFGLKQKLWVND